LQSSGGEPTTMPHSAAPIARSIDNHGGHDDPALVSPEGADDPMLGRSLLGRYRLEAVLGAGGSSVIYRGVHTTIGRTVAIKMLRPELVRNSETVARFLREGRAACRVRHEHVVEATDFGVTPEGDVFLVMEYLEGEDLAELLEREGPLPWPRARAIALQICEAIDAAHAAGVIHRDITLQNCFRVHRERNPDYVKVIDFGIAKMLDGSSAPTDECGVTGNAEIFGTPEYMAPEQVRRAIDADARTDVYALGVVLYALVTGRLPVRGATALDTLVKQIYDDIVPPSRIVAGLPAQLEDVIMRALEKDPDARFPGMAELAAALERVPVLGLVDPPAANAMPPAPRREQLHTDMDLPPLAEHDFRHDAPAERLLQSPMRHWAKVRWPMAAAIVGAMLIVGVGARDDEPPPPTEVARAAEPDAPVAVASVVPTRVSPARPTVAPTPPRAMPDVEPAPISSAPLPAVAVATAHPPKSTRGLRRSSARAAAHVETDADAIVEAAHLPSPDAAEAEAEPIEADAPMSKEPQVESSEAPLSDASGEPIVPEAPRGAAVRPSPSPFTTDDLAEEIKDPFGGGAGAAN